YSWELSAGRVRYGNDFRGCRCYGFHGAKARLYGGKAEKLDTQDDSRPTGKGRHGGFVLRRTREGHRKKAETLKTETLKSGKQGECGLRNGASGRSDPAAACPRGQRREQRE